MAETQSTFHIGKDHSRLFIIGSNHSHTIGDRFSIFSAECFMNQEQNTTQAVDGSVEREGSKFSYRAACRGLYTLGLCRSL